MFDVLPWQMPAVHVGVFGSLCLGHWQWQQAVTAMPHGRHAPSVSVGGAPLMMTRGS